ncbi:hypothetical protein [Pseudoglutamicibacter cumminsii]|uniref:hypothetical protein n=1 Tax=Pseudoglutamicibacter cumminsii TaxID=156979 RepID=UPI001959934B|nr:hypothetical protein [Pseudoglutamicibacter cumminsii]MBM7795973.1 hypothetical protein [Pseudoglutamicibacter cumminsii]
MPAQLNRLRLWCAPGTSPDKWLQRFGEARPDVTVELIAGVSDSVAFDELLRFRVDVALVRHNVDEALTQREFPGGVRLHAVGLYDEDAAIVAARDHDAEYWDEHDSIPLGDAAEWMRLDPADYPDDVSGQRMMVDVVATGAGAVAELPFPLARMLSRKDVVVRRLQVEPRTRVSVVWVHPDSADVVTDTELSDTERESREAVIQDFVGILRGRRAGSSRASAQMAEKTAQSGKQKTPAQQKARTSRKGSAQRSSVRRSGFSRKVRRKH